MHSRAQKLILEQRVRKVRDNRVRKEIWNKEYRARGT